MARRGDRLVGQAPLLALLRHADPVLVAQGVELAMALDQADRLLLVRAILARPWRPGAPWMALRVCADSDDAATHQLRQWSLENARRMADELDEHAPHLTALTVAARYLRGEADDRSLAAAAREVEDVLHRIRDLARSEIDEDVDPAQMQASSRRVSAAYAVHFAMQDVLRPSARAGIEADQMIRRILGEDWPLQTLVKRCHAMLHPPPDGR
ncbi:MAG: hypothetical protein AAFV53_38550 [Myxococcota bacterium]